jgi:hypothetical protein
MRVGWLPGLANAQGPRADGHGLARLQVMGLVADAHPQYALENLEGLDLAAVPVRRWSAQPGRQERLSAGELPA